MTTMNSNFPESGLPLFIREAMKEETDSSRICDMAMFHAKLAGVQDEYTASYGLGYVASMLAAVNARG